MIIGTRIKEIETQLKCLDDLVNFEKDGVSEIQGQQKYLSSSLEN